jgi:hypothetical protein
MRRAALACVLLAVLLAGALALLGGCGTDGGAPNGGRPPETVITYGGVVDTVNSHLRVRWWGEDADGQVVGYEYRWTANGGTPGPWTFTAATTDSFALSAPAGSASHRFEVRAIDDDDLADPTPAEQVFPVTNHPPAIVFSDPGGLPAVTLPAITVAYRITDEDGDASIRGAEAWLDGEEDRAKQVAWPESLVTFYPADFTRYGERTLYLRAIDDASAVSNTLTSTWTVTEPVGTVLLIDDMPDDIAGALTFTDPFYRTELDTAMAGRPYTVHRIEDAPFRTEDEAGAILALFAVVVWYQGTNAVVGEENVAVDGASLRRAEAGIRDLLARGGRFFLSTMNAVGAGGACAEDFAREVLGVDPESILLNPDAGPDDSNFFLKTRYLPGQPLWDLLALAGSGLPDVRVIGSFWGLELFEPAAGRDAYYTIPAGIVFPGQEAAAVATRGSVAGGRVVYLAFPLDRCTFENRHREAMRIILHDELGL